MENGFLTRATRKFEKPSSSHGNYRVLLAALRVDGVVVRAAARICISASEANKLESCPEVFSL
jgi:hypothetical protein